VQVKGSLWKLFLKKAGYWTVMHSIKYGFWHTKRQNTLYVKDWVARSENSENCSHSACIEILYFTDSLFTMECIHSHFKASSVKSEILLKRICFKYVGLYIEKSFQCTWHNVKSGLTSKIHKLGFRLAGHISHNFWLKLSAGFMYYCWCL
jgi:hypothetical protein